MLSEYTVGDADDVGRDPAARPSMARKAAVDDRKFLVREDHAVFVSQRWRCVRFFKCLRHFMCYWFESVLLNKS